jgi:signal transduction histidine kinase
LQRLANRLVYGYRASPYEVLATFSRRIGAAISSDELLPGIAEAAWRGLGASHARVRLLGPSGVDRVVIWPPTTPPTAVFEYDRPVLYHGEFVGEIALSKPAGEPLTRAESVLLEDLAAEAGPALHNVRLTLELQARADELAIQAEELRASRQRIVSAQDAERRRLERDIHDGAQQSLVAMAVQLRLLKALVRKSPERAESLADDLGLQATDALTELRTLARGIFPPLLADRGLVAALRSQIHRAGGDVHLTVPSELDQSRFAPELETATYFCIREALQNAAKHAAGAAVEVVLAAADGWLCFEVRDAGPGFAPDAAAALDGTGLQGMRDRLAALGGELSITSARGQGTTVCGRVPACQSETSRSGVSSLLET